MIFVSGKLQGRNVNACGIFTVHCVGTLLKSSASILSGLFGSVLSPPQDQCWGLAAVF